MRGTSGMQPPRSMHYPVPLTRARPVPVARLTPWLVEAYSSATLSCMSRPADRLSAWKARLQPTSWAAQTVVSSELPLPIPPSSACPCPLISQFPNILSALRFRPCKHTWKNLASPKSATLTFPASGPSPMTNTLDGCSGTAHSEHSMQVTSSFSRNHLHAGRWLEVRTSCHCGCYSAAGGCACCV